jgi:kynurenine formamidase
LTQLADALARGTVRVVDLTQTLEPATPVIGLPPVFAASPGVTIDVISKYNDAGPAWYWNALRFGEHTGTHFDAPIHWVTGKDLPENACDTIPARRFVGPACVIDATPDVARNADFLLTVERIEHWEREHGRIPAGAWVLLQTGWSRRRDPAAFVNLAADGPHSPGFDPRASRLLAHDRDVLGVGVETIGTDAGQAGGFDPPFPNHTIMHGAGKFGLASLCNLDQLPPTGAIVIAAPLKIIEGSGSPLRVIALTPA